MILLDTQSVIWMSRQQERMSEAALQAIAICRRQGDSLAVCDITLWEFAMLARKGRIALNAPLEMSLKQIANVYTVLPITPTVANTSVAFSSNFPGDPADRLIAATAIVHGISLITSDRRIRNSGEVPCIW